MLRIYKKKICNTTINFVSSSTNRRRCWQALNGVLKCSIIIGRPISTRYQRNRERNKVSKIRIGELFKKGTLTLDAFRAIIDMLYLSLVKLYYFICYTKQAVLSYWKAEHWKIGKIKFLILPFFIGEENLFSCKRSWKEKLKQFNQTEKCPPPPPLRHPLPPKLRQKMTKVSLW